MNRVRRQSRCHSALVALWLSAAMYAPAEAIFWNNDPAHGVTSTSGLTDRVDWFQNVHMINNTSNSTFGTTTLLDAEWAITVRHVVQNGGDYGQITAPGNVYVNVLGTRYYADQIFTPDGGSEMALVHLRGGVNGALDARNRVNSSFDEANRLVHVGGYGYHGYFGAGGTLGLGSFHRAYNIPFVAGNGQLRIVADGEGELAANGLLEGTVGSGDSGGPMWAYFGRGFNIENATMDQWRLVGLTATGTGGSSGEAWGGSSNYTRVANYATWINNTLHSLPPPGPSTTGPWIQDVGSGLYDTGSDKFSVTGSNAAPIVHASFGPSGDGFTLDSIGDTLSMSAIIDTTFSLGNIQLRYGMFDDVEGTIPGNVPGGMPWNGYFVGNATEDGAQGVYEKGAHGGGVGQWWSFVSPNSAPIVGRSTFASGTYDDPGGTQSTPAGRYAMSLEYTRLATGLQIDWSTIQVDAANTPTGVYSHSGRVADATPAASSWNYNQLGFFLFGSSFTGTIIVDDVHVALTPAVPEPSGGVLASAALLLGAAAWRRRIAATGVVTIGALVIACVFARTATADILSAKRGFADTGANYSNLQATGAGWYYTWGTGPANPGNFDAKHYPMFWNAPSQSSIDNVKSRNSEYVLGFNEPERPDQANMTVAQAIASWTAISNSFADTTTKLVSPAVADTGGANGGQAWLASFMQQATANNLKVDAVAFHWYGVSNPNNPAGAASSFLSRVDSYHNQYNLPVFITEFAIHDWGGAYTDAEIIEANRQFLNIVVPALESRSYVAGYSWYHWFSDAPLYSGNPAAPTPMGYSYVGAVGPGQLADVSGQNLGEHVAYVTGGELTMNGATAGTIRYLNALTNTSTVSGSLDWALAGTNWIRIQPGATLRKSGANQIAFSGGSVTNNGLLEVAEGTLRISSSIGGTGDFRIKDGTLDVTGANRGLSLLSGQTLENESDGTVVGVVSAFTGATIAGGGNFAGNLNARFGSTVRIGMEAAGVPTRLLIDNFEGYALGDVRTVAEPPWTAHQNTSLADIENFNGNKVLTYGWVSDFRGVSRSLPDSTLIENDQIATFFFRINSKTDDPDHNFGLGDRATTGTVDFGDFEAQLRMKQGSSAGTFSLDARNGGAFSTTLASGLALNTWYNIWMVVDQATDTYDVYLSTGIGAATTENKLNATPLMFRNGTTSELNTILSLAGTAPIDNGVRIDDLVYLSGLDLTNPVAGFDPGFVWTAETLAVAGNYTQDAGATLQIDLGGNVAGQYDVLDVAGTATLDGNLHISFAQSFAPAPGDVFHVLNATNVVGTLALSGQSAGFSLLRTAAGMALYFGDLPPGDYDRNGAVNAADYDVWKATYGSAVPAPGSGADGNGDGLVNAADFTIWHDHLGASVVPAGGASSASVPEPAALWLMAMSLGYRLPARRMACRITRSSGTTRLGRRPAPTGNRKEWQSE